MDIKIQNGLLTAAINTKGAELNSLKDMAGKEYIWEGDPAFWGKHSPVLFPIVGTLRNNSYLFEGRQYGMTRHGFARDTAFTVKEQEDSCVVFSLTPNENTKTMYPFDFDLELSYILNESTLHIYYTVANNGAGTMPFSIGAHPAFALPGNFEDYSLIFEKEEKLQSTQLENDLLSASTVNLQVEGKKLPLSYSLFKNDALILTQHASRTLEIARKGKPLLKVAFNDFPHLGIWTKENAPFLCIEPWQGYSDSHDASGSLIEKEGMIILSPGEKFRAGFSIIIVS